MMGKVGTARLLIIVTIQTMALRTPVLCVDTKIAPGILIAEVNGTTEEDFCLRYFPSVSKLPPSREKSEFIPFKDLTPSTGCNTSDIEPDLSVNGKVVALDLANCSLLDKAVTLQKGGAYGVIVVIPHGPVPQPSPNASISGSINISLTVISQNSLERMQSLGSNVRVLQYAPVEGSHIDYSLVVIWFMAMISVIIGSVWSRNVSFYLGKVGPSNGPHSELDGAGHAARPRSRMGLWKSEEQPLIVSSILIVCFVICMCGMLLLLYFFYDYLVYVIIALFCFASTSGLYQCLEPFVLVLPFCRFRLPACNAKKYPEMPDLRQVLLFIGCVTLTITWFIYRKESFSWILQDILGICFVINLLRIARLPSFKICTVLLVLLFFYDIFFVFITPLFTKNGESVMVEVATGGSSQEQMPMVLRVPHLGVDPFDFCSQKYSMLGFGDMLVPGLLVAYCYSFDVDKDTRKVYFLTVVTAYGAGLLITFAGLYLMDYAQPALLYLVPCMLVPVAIIGLCRREFNQLWTGDIDDQNSSDSSERTSSSSDAAVNESLQDGSNRPNRKIISLSDSDPTSENSGDRILIK